MNNTTVMMLAKQMNNALHILVDGVMHGITPIVNNRPEGFPVSVAARMGHIGYIADMMFVGAVGGRTPLVLTDEWKDNTGYSIPHPGMTDELDTWMRNMEVEIHQMHIYVTAVLDQVKEIIGGLTDEDLAREIDFGPMGTQTIQRLIEKATSMMYITAGEISVLRVMQGLSEGYPEDK